MKFRLKAFALHIAASACVLALVLGSLYLGWYRWPGWYLTGVLHVATVMAAVDLVLGPSLTLLIASPSKQRRELTRDIAVIVAVQVAALVYGAVTLWHGRPLYYTFSEDRLEMVQASDLDPAEVDLARKVNPTLAPHWYSLPRWVWAPLPDDEQERNRIMSAAITGGNDVIQMPRYFKPWEQGGAALRKQLKKIDEIGMFSKSQKETLKRRMADARLTSDQANTLFLTGRNDPVLAVLDGSTMQVKAIIGAD